MKRITPRTCLWPLTGVLVFTFILSIGLTYRSDHHCYAGVCGEWLFPLQARLHVVVWYLWISLSVTFLAFRAFQPSIQSLVHRGLGFNVPLLGKPMCISGALLVLWIFILYGATIGNWWIEVDRYFTQRGQGLAGNNLLAAIALTGHLCDITMGMVLLPVSRNSALASFFKLSPSTTFTFHMVMAYTLFGLVIIHGSLYAGWAAIFNRHKMQFELVYPVLNPTYLYNEVWPGNNSSLSVWRASLIFTGSLSSLIMLMMFLTTFPAIRRKHFNLFYFTHLLGIVAVIVICLHASTMLYCTLPGLSMWVLDWGMRVYELSGKLDSRLSALGNGWYCLTLPLPRKRLSGCACHSPLAHFYIHHTGSSIREIHPFTTITHLASRKTSTKEGQDFINIQFLFRKSTAAAVSLPTSSAKRTKVSTQWTHKLAALVDEEKTAMAVSRKPPDVRPALCTFASGLSTNEEVSSVETTLRLEGPYFTPATPAKYENVLCLVAGTGLSGALAIAAAFRAAQGEKYNMPAPTSPMTGADCTGVTGAEHRLWKRCVVVWTVREADYTDMPFVEELRCDGFEFIVHKTGKGRARPDMDATLASACGSGGGKGTWVYISGPNGFIDAGQVACRKVKGVEWFAAKWD